MLRIYFTDSTYKVIGNLHWLQSCLDSKVHPRFVERMDFQLDINKGLGFFSPVRDIRGKHYGLVVRLGYTGHGYCTNRSRNAENEEGEGGWGLREGKWKKEER